MLYFKESGGSIKTGSPFYEGSPPQVPYALIPFIVVFGLVQIVALYQWKVTSGATIQATFERLVSSI